MIRSPKLRFHDRKDDVNWLAELVANPRFTQAADAAMAQMVYKQPANKDAQSAISMGHRVEGAQEFLGVLLTLADVPEPISRQNIGNLPDNVRKK